MKTGSDLLHRSEDKRVAVFPPPNRLICPISSEGDPSQADNTHENLLGIVSTAGEEAIDESRDKAIGEETNLKIQRIIQ